MEIVLDEEDKKWTEEYVKKKKMFKKIIGIAPGGARNPGQEMGAKRWGIEKYAQLVSTMIQNFRDLRTSSN